MTVVNNGTVRLNDIQIQGPDNSCLAPSAIWPGDQFACNITRAVTQTTDFDAREADANVVLNIPVTVTGESNVTTAVLNNVSSTKEGLELPIYRQLEATASLSKTEVNATGKPS